LRASLAVTTQGVGAAATVDSLVVEVISAGDSMDLPMGGSVVLDRPDGPEVDLTHLLVRESSTRVSLGPLDLTGEGVYYLRISGAPGQPGVILMDDALPLSELELGVIELGFERLADDTVIAPVTATVTLPTRGTTLQDSAVFTGLPGGTEVRTELRTHTGTTIVRTDTVAAGQSSLTITDVAGGVDARAISGYQSRLSAITTAP
jgi:hypothetical protein